MRLIGCWTWASSRRLVSLEAAQHEYVVLWLACTHVYRLCRMILSVCGVWPGLQGNKRIAGFAVDMSSPSCKEAIITWFVNAQPVVFCPVRHCRMVMPSAHAVLGVLYAFIACSELAWTAAPP